MESIIEHGKRKVGSLDDLLSTMREVRKRLSLYEERIARLPDARTSFIPSMVITLLDGEEQQLVRMKQASGDFEKMFAAVEEFIQTHQEECRREGHAQADDREPRRA